MTDAKINFPFPHRELTLIDGRPNPQSLKKLFSEVYDNAFAVKSQVGGGQFGHLGAVMPAAQYPPQNYDTILLTPSRSEYNATLYIYSN
jgi:hypothetical protein